MDAVTESLRNYQNDEAKRDREDDLLREAFERNVGTLIAAVRDSWASIGASLLAGIEVDAPPEINELPRRLVEAVNAAIDDYAWELAKKEVARS